MSYPFNMIIFSYIECWFSHLKNILLLLKHINDFFEKAKENILKKRQGISHAKSTMTRVQ